MGAPRVNFRAHADVAAGLAARGARLETSPDRGEIPPGRLAEDGLRWYYALLGETLKTVSLSEGEASLLVDILNSTILEPQTVRYLWAEVEDSLVDGTAEKWGIDGPALAAKLRALSYAQDVAVYDAARRFWRLGDHQSMHDGLVAVGLIRREISD